ncbi:laccase domain-containing protein [Desulfohalobiaceae bacterium Ax17]|uniref:polyphenol oxidase family protein n=1 Tax=Desulfovulcanus ferrireducens TaxID=2831190 RepID=UPI00207B99AE|nr:polyphenol oxidase family protein [Desulfovulcanus ferrireducens]MBT8763945.1 laccase domain-containing protein [Desulfovulcanus ferrireducens]
MNIKFSFPGLKNIICVFGTRLGGQSQGPYMANNISLEVGDEQKNVLVNRQKLKHDLGFSKWIELKQVHGTDIHFDLEEESLLEIQQEGDGLATQKPSTGLVIKTADCQPIFLAHKSGRFIAALHCGWRGNRADFPIIGVQKFCSRYNLQPAEVLAVRGPSLGPCCAEFQNFDEHWPQKFAPYFNSESQCMNLWALTRDQLQKAGIKAENIFSLDLCTKCLEQLFFSYRRERTCGRQANIIFRV